MKNQSVQKKFTILHSNDIHGDFQAEVVDGKPGKMVGGLSLLSGYINKVRKEEKNVDMMIGGHSHTILEQPEVIGLKIFHS